LKAAIPQSDLPNRVDGGFAPSNAKDVQKAVLHAIRRFTRLTNAFSKKLLNLKAAVALHFAYYNFCRVHSSLRVIPAMEAGLTDHMWELKESMAA
jgi:hypothetical protein